MSRHLYLGVAWFVLVGLSGWAFVRENRRAAVGSRRWPVLLLFVLLGGVLLLAWGAHGPLDGVILKLARKTLPRFVMIRQSVKVYCLLPTIMVLLLARTLPALQRWRWGNVLIVALVCLFLLIRAARLRPVFAVCPGKCRRTKLWRPMPLRRMRCLMRWRFPCGRVIRTSHRATNMPRCSHGCVW